MNHLLTCQSPQRGRRHTAHYLILIVLLLVLLPITAFPQKKDNDKKVTVCHKGETIQISQSALLAHLNHGDIVGSCFEGDLDGDVIPFFDYEEKIEEEIGVELTWLKEEFEVQGAVPSNELFVVEGNKVLIEIIASHEDYLPYIEGIIEGYGDGAEVFQDYENDNDLIITALFPINKLNELNADLNHDDDIVAFARNIPYPILGSGIITNQGDQANQSEGARPAFRIDGSGTKICVISDSYNVLGKVSASVTNGDQPSSVDIIQDYSGLFTNVVDEGLAMLEIVHDLAPGAELAFRTGFNGMEDMAVAYTECEAAGCGFIVDDVTHLNEPFYEDGIINHAIEDVSSRGILCFSSAGNYSNKGHEGSFNPDLTDPTFHNFGNGGINQRVRFGQPGTYIFGFQWDDVYKSVGGAGNTGAINDLDIALVDLDGNNLVTLNTNNIGKDPIEIMAVQVENSGAEAFLRIRKASGPDNPNFKYVVFVGGQLFDVISELSNTSTIIGHPNAESAYAVGAAYYEQTPAVDGSNPVVEPFSSHGGMLVDGVDRLKPDFIAADGGNISQFTGVGIDTDDLDPFPNFFGTSAAAPVAAAVAALVSESKTKFEVPDIDIIDVMKSTALDIGETGHDDKSGAGFILADAAVLSFAAAKPNISGLEVPEGVAIGEEEFEVTISGNYFDSNSTVQLDGASLLGENVAFVNSNTLTATIPVFPPANSGNIQVHNSSITQSGLDGGTSEPVSLFYSEKPVLKVIAIDTNRMFGEFNPVFTSRILVNDAPLTQSGLPQNEIDRLSELRFLYETSGDRWDNPTGIYYIRPVGIDSEDQSVLDDYDVIFQDGYLTVNELPITIIPLVPESFTYGGVIHIDSYTYDLYSDVEDNNDNIANLDALLEYINAEYKSTFPDEVTNAIVDRARIMVNRARILVNEYGWTATEGALANRARIMVNGTILIEVDVDLVTDYQDNPNGTLSDRARILVNGESFFNGLGGVRDELGNRARIMVNEGGLGSNEDEGSDFSNVTIIADSLDYVISQIYSVNLISGLEVNHPEEPRHYAVPGAFIAPGRLNFTTTYQDAVFDIVPAELDVLVHDKWIINGDPEPENSLTLQGLQYGESQNDIISNISFDPINYTGIGNYDIIPTIELIAPSNYILEENITPGNLRVLNENDLRFLIATFEINLVDQGGNVSDLINASSRNVEVYKDHIYIFGTQRNIEEYDGSGNFVRSIPIPQEVAYYLDFSALPNGDLALYDNQFDKIYFINAQGEYLETVNVLETPDSHLQSLDGVVVNNSLIVSEDGNKNLLKVDLSSYDVSVFRNLSHLPTGGLGEIDHYNGTFYLGRYDQIYAFAESDQDETPVAILPETQLYTNSMVVAGNYAYLTKTNSPNIYKVDLISGVTEILQDGFSSMNDIEILLPSPAIYYEIDLDPKYVEDLRSIDIDNDGTDELLVLTNVKGSEVNEGVITMYRWNNIEFQSIWNSGVYDGYPYGLKVHDMNKDGFDDFLFAYSGIRQFINDPEAIFISEDIISGTAHEPMAIDDFDGDQDWDIIHGGPGINSGYLKYYEQEQGSFTNVLDFTDGTQGSNYAETIDLGDGVPSIVNMELYTANVYVFQNLGNNAFSEYYSTNISLGGRAFSLAVADFDNDQDDDFVVTSWDKVHFFRQGSSDFDIGYSSPSDLGVVNYTQAIDINEDGWMDLIAASFASSTPDIPGELYLYLNKQNFVFDELKANIDPITGHNYGLAVADFDGDGKYDAAMGHDPVIVHFDILNKFDIPVQQAALRMATFGATTVDVTVDPGSAKESTVSEGNEWYVPEVGSETVLAKGNIEIYPNPVVDMLTIKHANSDLGPTDIAVYVYDVQGNPVQMNTTLSILQDGLGLDLSALSTGIYYLHIADGSDTEIFRIQKN